MLLKLCEILGHGRFDSSESQPLEDSGPSSIELPFVSNTGCVPFLIQGKSSFETRRGLGQGLAATIWFDSNSVMRIAGFGIFDEGTERVEDACPLAIGRVRIC